jgi:Leucine-rich repeat (LRR) protein
MIKKYNQYLKENIDYSDIDPYGEEIWDDDDELSPILKIAKQQGKPYDQITNLNCYQKNLDSLDGIENLIQLKTLWCNNNNLTSLNGIENLINLEYLYCYYNNLTNLDEIENLTHLKVLYCFGNNFSNYYIKYIKEYCKKKNIRLEI